MRAELDHFVDSSAFRLEGSIRPGCTTLTLSAFLPVRVVQGLGLGRLPGCLGRSGNANAWPLTLCTFLNPKPPKHPSLNSLDPFGRGGGCLAGSTGEAGKARASTREAS